MKFFPDSDTLTQVQWGPAPIWADFYQGVTAFGSSTWWSDKDIDPNVGEQPTQGSQWSDQFFFPHLPGWQPCGSAEGARGEMLSTSPDVITLNSSGLCPDCEPVPEPLKFSTVCYTPGIPTLLAFRIVDYREGGLDFLPWPTPTGTKLILRNDGMTTDWVLEGGAVTKDGRPVSFTMACAFGPAGFAFYGHLVMEGLDYGTEGPGLPFSFSPFDYTFAPFILLVPTPRTVTVQVTTLALPY